MIIKKSELIENIKCNLISIIILMNSFQLILSWDFNIRINMWIEYGLIFLILIISKFRIKNIKNIIIMIVSLFIFAVNILLVNSKMLNEYIKEFFLMSLPLIIIFLIDIDLKKFTKIFYIYNIINAILYLLFLLLNGGNRVEDYMTYGYYSIFSISYIIVYSYYHKHLKTLICAFITIPIILINGNRGIILIIGMLILLILLVNNKINFLKKSIIFILIIILLLNINYIAKFILDFISNNYDIENSYSIRNLYSMLESNGTEQLFGGRYDIYKQSIQEIEKHPLLGMGIASFNEKYGYFPHNIFLDVYSTFGIILGTIYLGYLGVLGYKIYKISKGDMQVQILFIFMIANIMKLMISKTFIHDSVIWLYISLGNLIITKYYNKIKDINEKEREELYEKSKNNDIYTNL